jgi:2-keto-3-deoxy-L-rhamnonate aldolase RhmA
MPLNAYTEASNEATVVVLQIESVQSVQNVEEIAAVEGIDVLLVGLADLSVDLGLDGAWHHATVTEHVNRIIEACKENNIAFGIPATDADMALGYIERGTRFIAVGDIALFVAAMKGFLEEVRSSSA